MPTPCENEKEDETSDVASEAGTYTVDKDIPEVTNARQSIDSVFGVQNHEVETKISKVRKDLPVVY